MAKVSDKVKVVVPAHPDTGEVFMPDILREVFAKADWTDDPGVGKAVLLPDGREVLNPVPFEAPVDYKPQESIMDMIDRRLKERLAQLKGDDVVDDTPEEAWDLDIADDTDVFSFYEIGVMLDDFPGNDPAAPTAQPKILEVKEEVPNAPDDVPSDPDPGVTGGVK